MLKTFIKIFSVSLLIPITFSFPLSRGEGQQRGPGRAPEITFYGTEETKWTEKREIPLPVVMGQETKEEPRVETFPLKEEDIGPMRKMSPSATQPGCAYSNRFTRGFAKVFKGDKAHYEQGRLRYFEGKYEEAIQSFQKLEQSYPDSPLLGSALYWIGEPKFRQGKDDEAFVHFQKAVEKYPDDEFHAYALYSSGWLQMKKGAYETGSQFFHQVHEKNPTHPIAESSLFWSGYCLYHLGQYQGAVKELRILLQRHPKGKWNPEAEYLMGVSYFRLQTFDEAEGMFKGFLKKFPGHPLEQSARYALAWSLVSLENHSEGRKMFEEILLEYPGTTFSDPIFWGILRTYLGTHEAERAIHFHQRFLSFFLPAPWVEQSLLDIGQYYFEQKDYANAASTFRLFLRTYPESDLQEWVYFMLGETHLNQKDYAGAVSAYRQVLEEKGKVSLESRVFSRLGYAHFSMKNYDEAALYWERFLSRFPDHSGRNEILYWMAEISLLKDDFPKGVGYVNQLQGDPVLYPKGLTGLGWHQFQKEQWKEANQYFLKVQAEFPHYESSPSLSLLIGECYLNQNEYFKARSPLLKLASLPEENKDREKALFLLGWMAYREERFADALIQFEKLIKSYPESSYRDDTQYWSAWAYFRKKDYPKAIEEYQRLIQDYPTSPLVPSAILKIGDGYYNLKKYDQAGLAYQQFLKDYPKSKETPEAEFGLILSLLQEKQYGVFVSRAESFLKRFPQHPLARQTLMQLGDHYQEQRQREKAIRTYRELVHLFPNTEGVEEAQFRVITMVKHEGKWAEAAEEMERFIRDYPKSPLLVDARVELGELYLRLRNPAKALDHYEWVVKSHPSHRLVKQVYLGMEEGYRNLGKTDQAEKALKELINRFPQDDIRFEGQLRLGLLAMVQKKFAEAISAFSAAARSPEGRVASQAQLKWGEAHREAGEKETAILQFSKVVYLYPQQTEVMEEALLNLGALYMEGRKFPEARQTYRKLLEKTKREDRKGIARKALDEISRRSGQ
jgi:TolA-binding protein